MRHGLKYCLRIIFALVIVAIIVASRRLFVPQQTVTQHNTSVVLIDPGHGGEDGGASAADGTLEKNINLAIALDLQDMLALWGVPTKMTRKTDRSIYDSGCTTTRQMKVSDMYNRLALYDAAALTISIHQNHFSVSKYNGAQVFYSAAHPESYKLAGYVREQILAMTQPKNTRELKKATDGIFLLHRTSRPAILVECGFLSNPQESEKLKTDRYQRELAFAIAAGYWKYITSSEE